MKLKDFKTAIQNAPTELDDCEVVIRTFIKLPDGWSGLHDAPIIILAHDAGDNEIFLGDDEVAAEWDKIQKKEVIQVGKINKDGNVKTGGERT